MHENASEHIVCEKAVILSGGDESEYFHFGEISFKT